MSFQHKPNTGSLFKNERKTTDKHPNATGTAVIDGVEYYVDAWTNDGAKGKYQSLKFKRKDEPRDSRQRGGFDDPDGGPPF